MRAVTGPFYENFKMAYDTIRGNKLRSVLTVIGVVIGVIVVMLMSSVISGIKVQVEKQVESFGTPVIDLDRNAIHVVSYTLEKGTPVFRLHALDLSDGREKLGGPVEIRATNVRARSACVGVGTLTSYSGSGATPEGLACASSLIGMQTVSRSIASCGDGMVTWEFVKNI